MREFNAEKDLKWANNPPVGDMAGVAVGLAIDVETMGLDARRHAIIEVGAVTFYYREGSGEFLGVKGTYSGFADPGAPIPPTITRITGIEDKDVAGKNIDWKVVEAMAEEAAIFIAHNAKFDKGFLEKKVQAFTKDTWLCSCWDIPWKKHGTENAKQVTVAAFLGYTFAAHRAVNDVLMLVKLLGEKIGGVLVLSRLLEVLQHDYIAEVVAKPLLFHQKDLVKVRGYRWDPGMKVWYTRLTSEKEVAVEVEFLYGEKGICKKNAKETHTKRVSREKRLR